MVRTASRPYLCLTRPKPQIQPNCCLAGFYRVRLCTQSSLRGLSDILIAGLPCTQLKKSTAVRNRLPHIVVTIRSHNPPVICVGSYGPSPLWHMTLNHQAYKCPSDGRTAFRYSWLTKLRSETSSMIEKLGLMNVRFWMILADRGPCCLIATNTNAKDSREETLLRVLQGVQQGRE